MFLQSTFFDVSFKTMDIILNNVTKKYGSIVALDSISCTFTGGKITTLLGPSGCGKTTLLNLIAGVITPNKGDIFFGTERINSVAMAERNIGYVFQDYSLYPNMTAYQNIQFPLLNIKNRKKRLSKQEIHTRIKELADLLQIEGLLNRRPNELSGGQQQRVAIGRALAKSPEILLMDEPFANLDKKLATELRNEIKSLQQKNGLTIILVTHNQMDANAISDEVALMKDGLLLQKGDSEVLYNRPSCLFAANFMGEYGVNTITRDDVTDLSWLSIQNIFTDYNNVYTVAFRPESLHVKTQDGGVFYVEKSIRNDFFWTIVLRNGSHDFFWHNHENIPVGSKVHIDVLPKDIMFFDREDKAINVWEK